MTDARLRGLILGALCFAIEDRAAAKCEAAEIEVRAYDVVSIEVDDGSAPLPSDTDFWTDASVLLEARVDGAALTIEADAYAPQSIELVEE